MILRIYVTVCTHASIYMQTTPCTTFRCTLSSFKMSAINPAVPYHGVIDVDENEVIDVDEYEVNILIDVDEEPHLPQQPTAARTACWNDLPVDCYRSSLLPFMPVSLRAVSRIWRDNMVVINGRRLVITLDLTDLDESKRPHIEAFLAGIHGHVSLRFTDRGRTDRRMAQRISSLHGYRPLALPEGWQWVYGIARSFRNAATLAVDFSGMYPRQITTSVDYDDADNYGDTLWESLAAMAGSDPAESDPHDRQAPKIVSLCIPKFSVDTESLKAFLARSTKSLRKLDLTSCSIHNQSLIALAPELGGALEELVLDKNIFAPSGGWAEPLAEALRRMGGLRTFSMKKCRLDVADINILSAALATNTELTTLRLARNNNWRPSLRGHWGNLGQSLGHMPNLIALDVSGYGNDDDSAIAIISELNNMSSTQLDKFKELDVSGYHFGVNGSQILLQVLKKMKHLRALKLNRIGFAPTFASFSKELGIALREMNELEELSLNSITGRSSWNDNYTRYTFDWLAEALMNKPNLRLLDLGNNHMGLNRLRVLEGCFRTLTGLRELYLPAANLGDSGVQSLFPTLRELVTLGVRHIALWGNGNNNDQRRMTVMLPADLEQFCVTCKREFNIRWPSLALPYRDA